jgi:hypothetical protein
VSTIRNGACCNWQTIGHSGAWGKGRDHCAQRPYRLLRRQASCGNVSWSPSLVPVLQPDAEGPPQPTRFSSDSMSSIRRALPIRRHLLKRCRPTAAALAYLSLGRRCRAAGANSSMKATPSPLAMLSSISSVGFALPFSIRLIAACSTLVSAARSVWLQPRSFRSRRTFAASAFDTAELRAGNLFPKPDRAIAARSAEARKLVYMIHHIFTPTPSGWPGSARSP